MVTIHNVNQGSDEWHQIREGKYTGSNAHKLLRYGASEFARTAQSGFHGNFFTERGHILEDEAIELYERITRRHILRPGFVTNERYPSCGYSPDGLDGSLGGRNGILGTLLEVKCFQKAKHLRVASGEIPLEVLAQIHFGLLICNLRQARLIVYDPDLEPKLAFKIIDIKYNRTIANNFKRILGKEAHAQTLHTA